MDASGRRLMIRSVGRPINLSANSLILFFRRKAVFDKCRKYSTNQPFFAKQSQISHQKSEYRRQNTECKNVYKCLSNKEIRSTKSFGFSQDFIIGWRKNKAKTNPKQSQTKPIRLRLWLRRNRFFSPGQCPGSTVAVFSWAGSPCHIHSVQAKTNFMVDFMAVLELPT